MKVSVIIINYNTRQLTSDCIQSVIKYTAGSTYEIILVDNASSECDPEIFSAQFPSIKLIKSTINGGFAYGNNLGIEQAVGEYILLLNSDTILQEDSIGKTVAAMEMHPEAGVLGCRMVFPDGTLQEAGCFVWRDGTPWMAGRFQDADLPASNYAREVDYCSGASLMIPRVLF